MDISRITVDEAEIRGYVHLYRDKWLNPVCPREHSNHCRANHIEDPRYGRFCDGRDFKCSSPDLAIVFTDEVA